MSPAQDPTLEITRPAGRMVALTAALDEAAVAVHRISRVKVIMNLVAGLVAATILPGRTCVAWVAAALIMEAWSWIATRDRARGQAFSRLGRTSFIVNYALRNLWWLVLAGLFWADGTPVGQATAAILVVAIGALFAMLFYTAPVVFLIAGSAPAIVALTVIGLGDGRSWREMVTVWGVLGLGVAFSLGRALETPSAQAHQRELNKTADSFRVLTENLSEIVSRMNLEGVTEYVLPAVFAVLGYQPHEIMGMSRREIIHPDSLRHVLDAVARMKADSSRSETIICQVRRKDGHYIWLEIRAKLVCENGVPVGIIDVSHDITERVAAEAALVEAKTEAEAATRAKAEFLANVSHEIRTPMNGILGALHLLDREPISEEGRELMRQAGDCGRMLSQLLNDVLDFSKIEAGQLDLSPEPMHAGEALEAVCRLLEPQARAKGIGLICEIEGQDLWIEADPVRVRQAMFNLVGNAVKFTVQGKVTARLVAEPLADGSLRVSLEVEDTGIGMTAEAQEHLFERFRQADGAAARRFGGTGLGLTITQALARMMGGEIRFSSVEGEGSSFCLSFDASSAQPVAVAEIDEGVLDGINILLVEDNATNRLVARTMLTRLGAKVEEAEDGVAGLASAAAGGHDLILMDIQMPHMDGVQCARAIRGLIGAQAQVPILALTANAMVHQIKAYRAAGMNGAVAKPIAPAALLAEIARVIAEAETQAA